MPGPEGNPRPVPAGVDQVTTILLSLAIIINSFGIAFNSIAIKRLAR